MSEEQKQILKILRNHRIKNWNSHQLEIIDNIIIDIIEKGLLFTREEQVASAFRFVEIEY